jgi:hypothetical protein
MRIHGANLSLMVAMAAVGSHAEELSLTPGLYQVEVRLSLPNVDNVAPPSIFTRCLAPVDLQSGQAFFVLSDNPLKQCELLDYRAASDTAFYRIACAGPNRGTAVAVFDTTPTTYHGTIKMNMGGKNMTMTEIQAGRRIAECP